MCFAVVKIHFGKGSEEGIIVGRLWNVICAYAPYAVPCFEIMAFYFSYKMFASCDRGKFKNRLKQLIFPSLSWAVIYIVVFWIFKDKSPLQGLSWLVAFILQVFVGHVYNQPMWFQTDLIISTIICYIVFKCFYKKKRLLYSIICIMGAVALISQYTGFNYALLGDLPNYLRYSTGRFAEMLPYTTIGLILGNEASCLKKKEHSLVNVIFWFAFVIFVRKILLTQVSLDVLGDNFGYAGIGRMLVGFGIIKLFDELNFIKLPAVLEKAIRKVAGLTYGCYIMHILVGYFVLKASWEFLSVSPFKKCLTIYIIGLLISYIILRILPKKYNFLI